MPRKPGEPHKYREIADDLRRRINAGEFGEKRKLASERDLRTHYDVSQMTVRQALGVLRDEGLIESRVGSGWYVAEWRPIVRNALKRLSANQWGEGRSMWDVDIDDRLMEALDVQIELIEAPADVARTLDLEEGEAVWRRNRLYAVEGEVVMRSTSYIPDDLARGTRITQIDSGPGGTYARLREAGHGPVQFREQLRCRLATPAEVDDLHLAAGAPVVEQHRSAMRADGRVVEINRMVLDASRFLFVYDFPA
ncbi:GntR family transcriptional regulator [Streptomyces sp. NBC_01373]|uniref:GntR family transcriptional regulator n=1 Tax=Streptomyces sp. NBC_01373 TaxID=2903843 RepID=UPI0022528621|nr:GntR family transcriptional regulator [Streptomyces sp. NBC_01373]MCX4697020.1 GntR family transcriptional regulator [Streptomyces sp. NBC_01373]MCX4707055.1 GntR family transcriptional regulator [Streptomyces sp. NBC_01373]